MKSVVRFLPFPSRGLIGGLLLVAVSDSLCLRAGSAAEPTPPPVLTPPSQIAGSESASQLTASARELVRGMQKAITVIAKARGESAARPTRKIAPFDDALGRCAQAVDLLAETLSSPDGKEPFEALRRTGIAVAALQVCYRYGGMESEAIDHAFRTLTATYGVLRRNYGRDLVAARNEAEEALNAAQKSALDELKSRGAACAKRLESGRPIMGRNPAVAFECEAMQRELARIGETSRNRRALLDTLTTAEIFLGRWEGLRRYTETVFPSDARELSAFDETVRALASALDAVASATYAASGPQAFAQPARYTEDIAITGMADADVDRLLGTLRASSPSEAVKKLPEVTPESISTAAAADRQINADDPDDDTSLDGGEDEEAVAREQDRAGQQPPR